MAKIEETSGPVDQNPPGRILVWTDDIRARIQDILARSIYEKIDIKMIDLGGKDSLAQFQYRRTRKKMQDMVKSIDTLGVLEDITLKMVLVEDGVITYFVVDGHTRLIALMQLLKKNPDFPIPNFRILPADTSDADAALIAVELNLHQENFDEEDLNASVIRLLEETDFTQKEIADFLDRSTSRINEIVAAFTKVPPEARKLIEKRTWSVKKGEELARLHNHKDSQKRIMENAIKSNYTLKQLKEAVDNEFAKFKAEKLATQVLRENPPVGKVIADDPKTITRGQFNKIKDDVVKKITRERSAGYSGEKEYVVEKGDGKYAPGPMMIRRLIKEDGYTIVDGDAPKEDIEEVQGKPKRPKMPSKLELMNEGTRMKKCSHCGGPIHPVIVEQMGFKTKWGNTHEYCDLLQTIKRLQKKLADDPITKMLEADPKLTLKKINNQSHQIYKDELERRKQVWRDENLPKPDKTKKKGPKAGELVDDKKSLTQLQLLERVRKKHPTIVKPIHFELYEKYLKKEDGYTSMNDVVESMKDSNIPGVSKGSVGRAFKVLKETVAKEAVQ